MNSAARWASTAGEASVKGSPFEIAWRTAKRGRGPMMEMRRLADSIPAGAPPKRWTWKMDVREAARSPSAMSYLEYMNPKGAHRMERGRAPGKMDPEMKRGDWTLLTVVASNMLPSATKGSYMHAIEGMMDMDKATMTLVRGVCPVCNCESEKTLTERLRTVGLSEAVKIAMARSWAIEGIQGTASHVLGTCKGIERPAGWDRKWAEAEGKMRSIVPLQTHDEGWLGTRPLRTLHRLLRGADAGMMEDVRKITAVYAKHTESSVLVVEKNKQ